MEQEWNLKGFTILKEAYKIRWWRANETPTIFIGSQKPYKKVIVLQKNFYVLDIYMEYSITF